MSSSEDIAPVVVTPPPLGARKDVPHVGSMNLTLPVSIDRMFENALDWEHLPWVHASSFRAIEKIDAGPWGWHAWAELADTGKRVRLELRVERDLRRWITRTHEGPGAGSEIWTNVAETDDHEIHLVLDFFTPSTSADHSAYLLEVYSTLYKNLYREDLELMVDRQAGLDARRRIQEYTPPAAGTPPEEVTVPIESDADTMVLEAFGKTWRIADTKSGPVAVADRCPHRLGSLLDAPVSDGEITCPWHGYRFDLATGACVSGQRLSLPPSPDVEISETHITLRRPARRP